MQNLKPDKIECSHSDVIIFKSLPLGRDLEVTKWFSNLHSILSLSTTIFPLTVWFPRSNNYELFRSTENRVVLFSTEYSETESAQAQRHTKLLPKDTLTKHITNWKYCFPFRRNYYELLIISETWNWRRVSTTCFLRV